MSRNYLFLLLLAAPAAFADLSANVGWQSQYIYRGIPQSDSSAQGGADFESSGFYVGTWAADVDMGAEVDLYGGYNFDVSDFTFGIGATGYYYTDDFDDTYQEINLSAGYKFVTLDYAIGEYDNFDGPTLDYGFYSATFSYEGFSAIIGGFSDDFDGDYYSLSYDFTVSEVDLSLAWIYSDDKILGNSSGESNVVFSVSKSFDLNNLIK